MEIEMDRYISPDLLTHSDNASARDGEWPIVWPNEIMHRCYGLVLSEILHHDTYSFECDIVGTAKRAPPR